MDIVETVSRILALFYRHRGKVLGILTGFVLSILFLTVGFWKTLFISICCTVGFIIGKKIDNREDFRDLIDRILPPRD